VHARLLGATPGILSSTMRALRCGVPPLTEIFCKCSTMRALLCCEPPLTPPFPNLPSTIQAFQAVRGSIPAHPGDDTKDEDCGGEDSSDYMSEEVGVLLGGAAQDKQMAVAVEAVVATVQLTFEETCVHTCACSFTHMCACFRRVMKMMMRKRRKQEYEQLIWLTVDRGHIGDSSCDETCKASQTDAKARHDCQTLTCISTPPGGALPGFVGCVYLPPVVNTGIPHSLGLGARLPGYQGHVKVEKATTAPFVPSERAALL